MESNRNILDFYCAIIAGQNLIFPLKKEYLKIKLALMRNSEALSQNPPIRFYTKIERVRGAAVDFINKLGEKTERYSGIFAKAIEENNPIGVTTLFAFDVHAGDHDKILKRVIRVVVPVLELEYKALGSVQRFEESAYRNFSFKLRENINKGMKVEKAVHEWLREKIKERRSQRKK